MKKIPLLKSYLLYFSILPKKIHFHKSCHKKGDASKKDLGRPQAQLTDLNQINCIQKEKSHNLNNNALVCLST